MITRKGHTTCCLRYLDIPYPVTNLSPSPGDTNAAIQYKLQKAKSEISAAQKSAKTNVEFITQEQQKVSREIESVTKAIKDLEIIISSGKCKTIHPKKLSDLCKVKSSLRIDLSNSLHRQSQLKRQLCDARIALRNARLDDHTLNEDIKKFKNKSWDSRISQMQLTHQCRLERESHSKKNAIATREGTITSVANSITAHVLQKLPGEHNVAQKQFCEARLARQNVNKYITKSLRATRKTRAVALTESQIRERRQADNLSRLKQEITEIQKTLTVKSHLKRLHSEEIAAEKEEVKNLLQTQGTNPYLAEYLLSIEEKQREIQRKMLVEEQRRLGDMQREYSTIEASKTKEEADRKKWDQFWSKRALDKQLQDRKSRHEMYFDVSGDEEEHELIKSELQMMVTERLHDRYSQFFPNPPGYDEYDDSESRKSRRGSAGESDTPFDEDSVSQKNRRQSEKSAKYSKGTHASSGKSMTKGQKRKPIADDAVVAASVRKAVHLEEVQKESLLRMAGTGENIKAVLMNGRNVFDFGKVPMGQHKYMMVNIANVGVDPVQLKMSILNPFGPFLFCNSLKVIPPDSYFSLKFKYKPLEVNKESQETIKIEEVGKPENFIIAKFKGHSVKRPVVDEHGE